MFNILSAPLAIIYDMLVQFISCSLTNCFIPRPAAGSRAGEDPAGEEQGAGELPQAPAGRHRRPGPGD